MAIAAVWSAALVFVVARALLLERLTGHAPVRGALANEVVFLLMWAVATPAILRSAARFPLNGPGWPRRLGLHVVFGTLFVVAINLVGPFLIRFAAGAPFDAAAALRIGASMLAAAFHLALVVYALIVLVGHYVHVVQARPRLAAGAATAAAPVANAPRVAVTPERPAAVEPALPVHGPLAVKADGRVRLIEQGTIDWIEADDDHVIVHAGASAWRTRERLAEVEHRLDPSRFVRIHRSTIVQVSRVRELEPWFHGDYVMVMQSGVKLRLSRTRRERVAKLLGRAL